VPVSGVMVTADVVMVIADVVVLQFFSDADDVDTWMLDMLRLVSSEDVGHDEASVQSLVKKHKVGWCCFSLC